MAAEKWPGPNNQDSYGSNPNQNQYNPAYPQQEVIEPANEQDESFGKKVQNFGTDFAKDQARDFAIGKAVDIATKLPIAGRFFIFTRWIFALEWGAFAFGVIFAILGVLGIIQHDYFLGGLVLVIAVFGFITWWLARKFRLFVERQLERAFNKFAELVRRGAERPDDWENWYRRNKARFGRQKASQ